MNNAPMKRRPPGCLMHNMLNEGVQAISVSAYDKLNGKRDKPLSVPLRDIYTGTIIDPESDSASNLPRTRE
jgi:hypothetical protein